jgi:hypothetical protein
MRLYEDIPLHIALYGNFTHISLPYFVVRRGMGSGEEGPRRRGIKLDKSVLRTRKALILFSTGTKCVGGKGKHYSSFLPSQLRVKYLVANVPKSDRIQMPPQCQGDDCN